MRRTACSAVLAAFTDALGNVDHTTVDVTLVRATGFTGVTVQLRDCISLSTQLYVLPAHVTALRLEAHYALR